MPEPSMIAFDIDFMPGPSALQMTRLPKIILAVLVVGVGIPLASSVLALAVAANDPRIFCEPGSEPFARAISPALLKAYGQPLSIVWQDFQADLRRHPAARWEYG